MSEKKRTDVWKFASGLVPVLASPTRCSLDFLSTLTSRPSNLRLSNAGFLTPGLYQRKETEVAFYRVMKQHASAQLSGYAVTRQLILEELDMEIRVRERLQETVESRIAWATCLQSSLGAVSEKQGAFIFQ